MMESFIIPFLTIGIAELGDKTQLAILCLASHTRKYYQLLLGIMLAFLIADGLAILLGDLLAGFIPAGVIKTICGLIFILFGILTLLPRKEEGTACKLKSPFLSGFGIVLFSEMGDKTQIASAMFAARFNPFMVFLGVISALTILSLMAIYLGKYLLSRLDRRMVSRTAGILFILLGVYCFF